MKKAPGDSRFGSRMKGEGPYAEHIKNLFQIFRKKYGLDHASKVSTASFRRPGDQLSFFEE